MNGRTLGVRLAGLGAGNAIVGFGLWRFGRGDGVRAFGQQATMWGLVDLGIAGVSLMRPAGEANRIRRVLLVNAGLDVVYIAGGAHVAYYGSTFGGRVSPQAARGHGLSVSVQGSQLLAFDLWHARQFRT